MLKIALVACAKAKLAAPAPAGELYASPLFQLTRRYVEAGPDYFDWYIVSAKHGLVDPDETLEPYDVTLAALRPAEREQWAERTASELVALYGDALDRGVDVQVDLYAGAPYRRALVPHLERPGFRVRAPLAGLRIGEQLAWLNRALERAEATWLDV